MQNKNAIIIITVVVSLLCLFSLSFTFISRKVQQEATAYASLNNGEIDLTKKQHYLDSIWDQPVYHFLGYPFTYQDVKGKELNLGLDLQGGMHLVLQVSPVEVIKALSNNYQDEKFTAALKDAEKMQTKKNEAFIDLFYQAFQKRSPNTSLSSIFANSRNQDHINTKSSDEQVISFIKQEINSAVDRSFEIVRNRIDKFGVAQANSQKLPGTERIQLELPGVDNPERVRKLVQGVAKLEFRRVLNMNEMLPYWQSAAQYWAEHHQQSAQDSAKDATVATDSLEQQLLQDSTVADQGFPIFSLSKASYGLRYQVRDTATINQTLHELQNAQLLPGKAIFLWDVKPGGDDKTLELYAVSSGREVGSVLQGDVITDAVQTIEQSGAAVSMQMNTEGTRKWRRMTAENIGNQIAIILDNQVYSAPVVQSEIPNGNSSISGNFTIDEAKDLANILKAGKMPAPVQIIEEAVVGPSLGQEAISQGLISMAAGLSLVVVFMIVYYGIGGIVANIALLFNIFFIVGILAQLGASLTLPGIAGLVLTIGMSVDANVLIFERIKEELNQGKNAFAAIKLGYDKAYSSIIDSNVTTFLTGLILYIFGSGGIKGFAVVLMIGIVSSLFTAVFISRIIIEFLARRGNKVSFSTGIAKSFSRSTQFNFIEKRKLAYTFSCVVIAVGMVLTFAQGGLNLGVDFKGGRSYVVHFDQPVAAPEVRSTMLEDFKGAGLEVKTFDQKDQLKITTSYLADDHSGAADEQVLQALNTGLENYQQLHPKIISSSKVGATIAQDVKDAAQSSVIFTLIAIFLYILIRFHKWQYGLGAIVALFHDVLMVFAGYAIARAFGLVLEVDQVLIAAVLTIIGYSINDTVVVFDRIREFSGKGVTNLASTYNIAINNTLGRTIITSLTVFIVVLILLIFGGEVLRGFSFALLIGVIFGTYSSIFIASPLALDVANLKIFENTKSTEKHLSRTKKV